MKLEVSPYTQQQPYSCLPACIKVVLQFHGIDIPEEIIQQVCNTNRTGTRPHDALIGLRQLGYEAILIEDENLNSFFGHLEQNHLLIVFLDAAELPYAEAGAHAVVVCGYEQTGVIYVDPALGREIQLDFTTFLRAWSRLNNPRGQDGKRARGLGGKKARGQITPLPFSPMLLRIGDW